MLRHVRAFRAALAFFTRLPVGRADVWSEHGLDGALAWLPAVGLLVGSLGGAALWLAAQAVPPLAAAVLTCLVLALLTGALHLDGVADCGDGLLSALPRERRLQVMREPQVGAFGVLALFFVLTLKIAALEALAHASPPLASCVGAVALATVLGRCAVFFGVLLPSARPDGMGSRSVRGTRPLHGLAALVLTLGLCLGNGWLGGGWAASVAACVAAAAATCAVLGCAWRQLGGVTGDVYGCLIEVTECSALIAAAVW